MYIQYILICLVRMCIIELYLYLHYSLKRIICFNVYTKDKYLTSFLKHFLHIGCSLSGAWLYCHLNHFLHMLNHLHYQGQILHHTHNQIFIIIVFTSKNWVQVLLLCTSSCPFLPCWSCDCQGYSIAGKVWFYCVGGGFFIKSFILSNTSLAWFLSICINVWINFSFSFPSQYLVICTVPVSLNAIMLC